MVNATNKAALRAALDSCLKLDIPPQLYEQHLESITRNAGQESPDIAREWFLKNWKDILIICLRKLKDSSVFTTIMEYAFGGQLPPNYKEIIEFMLQTSGSSYEVNIYHIVNQLSNTKLAELIDSLKNVEYKNSRAYKKLLKTIFELLTRVNYDSNNRELLRREAQKFIPPIQVMNNLTPDEYIEQIFQESEFYNRLSRLNINMDNPILTDLRKYYVRKLWGEYLYRFSKWHIEEIERAMMWYVFKAQSPISLWTGMRLLALKPRELGDKLVLKFDFWHTVVSKAIALGMPFSELDQSWESVTVLALPLYLDKIKENPVYIDLAVPTIAHIFDITVPDMENPLSQCVGCEYFNSEAFSTAHKYVIKQLIQLDAMPAHIQVATARAIIRIQYNQFQANTNIPHYLEKVMTQSEVEKIEPFLTTMAKSRDGRAWLLEISLQLLKEKRLSFDKYIEITKRLSA